MKPEIYETIQTLQLHARELADEAGVPCSVNLMVNAEPAGCQKAYFFGRVGNPENFDSRVFSRTGLEQLLADMHGAIEFSQASREQELAELTAKASTLGYELTPKAARAA